MTTLEQYGAASVAKARSELGTPYIYGKTDCEWLTRICAAAINVVIPWGSSEQWLDKDLPHIARNGPWPAGCLLYFLGSDSPGPGLPGHCGVNIGGGHMIDAPYTGVDVRIDSWSPTTTEGDLAFIGAIDIAQLGKALPATPEPTLYYKVPNMFGVPVILVQNRLCAKGLRIRLAYPGCPTGVDGQFGMRTSVAVKLFQTKEKIGVDGIVGSETWQALGL